MSDDNGLSAEEAGKDGKVAPLKPEPYLRVVADNKPASKPENNALLPSLDEPYRAAGFTTESELSRLVLVMGGKGLKEGEAEYVFLQYVHIGLGKFGYDDDGQWFTFIFSDIEPKLVTVRGRSILRYCDYISLRRLPWIRLADRDFRPGDGVPDDEPIITSIEITNWTPEE